LYIYTYIYIYTQKMWDTFWNLFPKKQWSFTTKPARLKKCCDVRCNFRVKTMFDSSLHHVVCFMSI
jgi:hypothetical protein